jgi:hypothetical protein
MKALGRLSTMIVWLSAAASGPWMMRVRKSLPPPGVAVTMRTGRVG